MAKYHIYHVRREKPGMKGCIVRDSISPTNGELNMVRDVHFIVKTIKEKQGN